MIVLLSCVVPDHLQFPLRNNREIGFERAVACHGKDWPSRQDTRGDDVTSLAR